MHALIIEDDALIAMLLEDELRDLGYNSVELACTEEEAIEAVARRCPDLITSDGSLMAGTGAGAIRQIRRSLAVPVIFITADPDRARECVPDAPILEKPFFASQLITAVEQLRSQPLRGSMSR